MADRRPLAGLLDGLVPIAAAFAATAVLFGAFLAAGGADPYEAFHLIWLGGFGTWFSWQNTLVAASPLLLTALCVALPAQLGLMVIGGGGDPAGRPSCGAAARAHGIAGMATGGALIGFCGFLRHRRNVNETISSLLLAYISIVVMNQLVEGPLRDPASLNRPSTPALPSSYMLADIPGTTIHVGLIYGLVLCVLAWVLVRRTTLGFAIRVAGGNARARLLVGLPVGRLILITTALGGAAAGLGRMIEVAAVQGAASADIAAGYGYTGILVAFLARQNPLAIIPVAILLGGVDASGGLLQQRLGVPDATILVLRGMLFVTLLAAETLRGRPVFARLGRAPAGAALPAAAATSEEGPTVDLRVSVMIKPEIASSIDRL